MFLNVVISCGCVARLVGKLLDRFSRVAGEMLIGLVTYINVSVVPAFKPGYNFPCYFFYTVVAKGYKKYMPPINAFCINCNILIKPQSVDAFCTKNSSLMQNASTLPTHFVTKKSKCTNCNIDAKCVVSMVVKKLKCMAMVQYPMCDMHFGIIKMC